MKKLLLILPVLLTPFVVFAANSYSAHFVGSSSQYAVNTSTSGMPTGSTARTYAIRVKTTSTGTEAFYDTGTDAGTGGEFSLLWYGGTNKLRFTANGMYIYWNATGVNDGNWHTIIVTYAGGTIVSNMSAYLDNNTALTQSSSLDGTINTSTACFGIGASTCSSPPGGNPSTADIDDVRIWSRVLSGTEITDLIANPCTFTNGSSFVSWYQLENNWNDSQGSNNLTAMNSPTFSSSVPYTCATASAPTLFPRIFSWW